MPLVDVITVDIRNDVYYGVGNGEVVIFDLRVDGERHTVLGIEGTAEVVVVQELTFVEDDIHERFTVTLATAALRITVPEVPFIEGDTHERLTVKEIATERLTVDLREDTEVFGVTDPPDINGGYPDWDAEQTGTAGSADRFLAGGGPDGENVLVINLDDVGIDLMGGITQYKTWLNTLAGIPSSGGPTWPVMTNIQAIADEGITFLNAYSTPNCSPGRACFQTGRFNFRNGVGEIVNEERASLPDWSPFWPWHNGFHDFGINPDRVGEVTEYILPRLLGENGVHSCIVGKWHLGTAGGNPENNLSIDSYIYQPFRWWYSRDVNETELTTDSGVLAHGSIPWEPELAYANNVSFEGGYNYTKARGWRHPLELGWDCYKGLHSNLERSPNDDLKTPFGSGTAEDPIDDAPGSPPADVTLGTGLHLKPGYYNYLWYDSASGTDLGEVKQKTEYITTYSRKEVAEYISVTPEPWYVQWEQFAAHAPFGEQPDNGAGYSGCIAPNTDINSTDGRYNISGGDSADVKVQKSVWSALESIDWNIGQLRAAMGEARWDRTTVIIRCDNGSADNVLQAADAVYNFGTYSDNVIGEDRAKRTVHEAGIRVPLIVSGPHVGGTAGRVTYERVQAVDFYPTIMAITQTDGTPAMAEDRYFDGHNFYSVLQSDSGETSRDFVYVERFNPNGWTPRTTQLTNNWTDWPGYSSGGAGPLPVICHRSVQMRVEYGSESPGDYWGWFKGVLKKTAWGGIAGHQLELYRLADKDGVLVDPYETVDLITNPGSGNAVAYNNVLGVLKGKLNYIRWGEPDAPGEPGYNT